MLLSKKYWNSETIITDFIPLVAPTAYALPTDYAANGCTVNVYAKFKEYRYSLGHTTARLAVELQADGAEFTLTALLDKYYIVGETIGGVETVTVKAINTAFTYNAASTKRWYIICDTTANNYSQQVGAGGLSYTAGKLCQVFVAKEVTETNNVIANSTTLKYIFLESKTTLKKILVNAFSGCSGLNGNVTIPDSVTEIGASAFSNCISLDGTLKLSDNLVVLGSSTFDGCVNMSGAVVIPNSVTSIQGYSFRNCYKITSLIIGSSVTMIDISAFQNCIGLRGNLTIQSSCTIISATAFQSCGFDGILTLHNGILTIGTGAFRDCKFTGNLLIPNQLTRIEAYTFYANKFTGDLVVPSSVTFIGRQGIGGYSDVATAGTLTLPSSVAQIDFYAFYSAMFNTINSYILDISDTTKYNVSAWRSAISTTTPFHITTNAVGYEATWGTLATYVKFTNFIKDL